MYIPAVLKQKFYYFYCYANTALCMPFFMLLIRKEKLGDGKDENTITKLSYLFPDSFCFSRVKRGENLKKFTMRNERKSWLNLQTLHEIIFENLL